MKAIFAILVLVVGIVGIVLTRESSDDHRTCSCSGTFCSCDVSCLDHGEMPTCTCGTFSCICKCVPKDENNAQPVLPTLNADQEANSIKSEKYFRDLGTSQTNTIANGIKTLREAIRSGDITRYSTTATLVETTYQQLSAGQQSAWETWSTQHLKK